MAEAWRMACRSTMGQVERPAGVFGFLLLKTFIPHSFSPRETILNIQNSFLGSLRNTQVASLQIIQVFPQFWSASGSVRVSPTGCSIHAAPPLTIFSSSRSLPVSTLSCCSFHNEKVLQGHLPHNSPLTSKLRISI